ncbi:MAG: hypothetical protein DGJ47_000212 [Rickettsiaceae bacterium]
MDKYNEEVNMDELEGDDDLTTKENQERISNLNNLGKKEEQEGKQPENQEQGESWNENFENEENNLNNATPEKKQSRLSKFFSNPAGNITTFFTKIKVGASNLFKTKDPTVNMGELEGYDDLTTEVNEGRKSRLNKFSENQGQGESWDAASENEENNLNNATPEKKQSRLSKFSSNLAGNITTFFTNIKVGASNLFKTKDPMVNRDELGDDDQFWMDSDQDQGPTTEETHSDPEKFTTIPLDKPNPKKILNEAGVFVGKKNISDQEPKKESMADKKYNKKQNKKDNNTKQIV